MDRSDSNLCLSILRWQLSNLIYLLAGSYLLPLHYILGIRRNIQLKFLLILCQSIRKLTWLAIDLLCLRNHLCLLGVSCCFLCSPYLVNLWNPSDFRISCLYGYWFHAPINVCYCLWICHHFVLLHIMHYDMFEDRLLLGFKVP